MRYPVLNSFFFFVIKAELKIKWLSPFTEDELSVRGIVDVIFDLEYLSLLYPNTSKECFREYRKKRGKLSDGYATRTLKWIDDDMISFDIEELLSLPMQSPDSMELDF